MYVYCVVCYRVIAAPYVRSVGHVFAYLYTLDDNLERPMDLLPKDFHLQLYHTVPLSSVNIYVEPPSFPNICLVWPFYKYNININIVVFI